MERRWSIVLSRGGKSLGFDGRLKVVASLDTFGEWPDGSAWC